VRKYLTDVSLSYSFGVFVTVSTHYYNLKDKVIFITGGASGIGAAMVQAFSEQGAKVAFVDIDEAASNALTKKLPNTYWHKSVDVTNPQSLQSAVDEAAQALGGLDVLINNVANDMRHAPENIAISEWQKCMSINLDPTFFASQAAYKIMSKQKSGSIINFSSINALLGQEQMTGYVTAKAGIIGMTKSLAHDFGINNVRVNAILPGWVATQKQLDSWLTNEEENRWMQTMALKKRIEPQDVANLALFLASNDSALITGQSIAIDGGKT
jgi:NAD(P)-dependent dehydrogenase (short-subunit alcohol dehydrogenase family)